MSNSFMAGWASAMALVGLLEVVPGFGKVWPVCLGGFIGGVLIIKGIL